MLEITTRQQCAEVPELLLLMVLQHDLITNTYRQVQSFFKNLQNVQKLNLLTSTPLHYYYPGFLLMHNTSSLVPWLSGKTLVFDRRAFAVLRLTYS